ncbi:MAG: Rpn family recombination-promoting nuclease/putative transposase [Firmicutes bacterium]|nr:Rpn family recombination-promoting nuclease/putative transposase [Bacillota bacterium]
MICNIEMQTTNKRDHGKRVRFYQSAIDSDLLDKGKSVKELCRSYVIFLCPFDPFGKGRRVYRFETLCREHPEIDLKTEAEVLFVSATEETIQEDNPLGHFLRYMLKKVPTDNFTEKVHEAVKNASRDAEWRKQMYTWQMKIQEERELAAEEAERNIQRKTILRMKERGLSDEEIADLIDIPLELVIELKNSQ